MTKGCDGQIITESQLTQPNGHNTPPVAPLTSFCNKQNVHVHMNRPKKCVAIWISKFKDL